MPTRLIVNADDFGQSTGVNRGIIRAHNEGVVTSTSLMVRWPAAQAAVELAREFPALSLGIHIDLGEWAWQDGSWIPVYEVVSSSDETAMSAEIDRQFTLFMDLVGRTPDHIDSHQHVHTRPPARQLLESIASRGGIPLRHYGPAKYCGDFYGQTTEGYPYPQGIALDNLLRIIKSLEPGLTEVCCHPAEADHELATMYNTERQQELTVLCDRRARDAIRANGVELCSFEAAT